MGIAKHLLHLGAMLKGWRVKALTQLTSSMKKDLVFHHAQACVVHFVKEKKIEKQMFLSTLCVFGL